MHALMRLFIAIQLDDGMKRTITETQAYLRKRRVGGNYTKPENLHVTLAFIGEYNDPDRVLEVMQTLPFAPIPISLEGFGCFGDLYWCGLGGEAALSAYVRRLRRALADAGIPFDRKRFSPHITLIRRASFTQMPAVEIPGTAMTVRTVTLMRSDRGSSGIIYTELGSVGAEE